MPDITIHTIETAPEEVKDVLQTVKDANGQVTQPFQSSKSK